MHVLKCYVHEFGFIIKTRVLPLCFKYEPSGPISVLFLQQSGSFVSNNSPYVIFQGVNHIGLICVDKRFRIIPEKMYRL